MSREDKAVVSFVTMFAKFFQCLVLYSLVVSSVHTLLLHDVERPSLSALSSRVAAHAPRLEGWETRQTDPRLPLPGAQELEAIKKVAQLLVMLGEQVIPAIIGNIPAHASTPAHEPSQPTEIPSDPVQFN